MITFPEESIGISLILSTQFTDTNFPKRVVTSFMQSGEYPICKANKNKIIGLKKERKMQVILHMPSNTKDKKKLQKNLAEIHAEGILSYINKMPCSKEQKLQILNGIINDIGKEKHGN